MYLKHNINWHEGLFLEPHHFQLLQKNIQDGFAFGNLNNYTYPYGIIEIKFNEKKLEIGWVEIELLKAVMPDGTYIDVSQNAVINNLNVKEKFDGGVSTLDLDLVLPAWSALRNNTAQEGKKANSLYIQSEVVFNDENKGYNDKNIATRKFNCQLAVSEKSPDNNLNRVHLLRLKTTGRKRIITIDDKYIPPCLFLDGNKNLLKLIDQFAFRLEASAKEHLHELSYSPMFYKETPRMIKPILKSMVLNENHTRFSELLKKPFLTPYEIFIELKVLAAKLCTFTADFFLMDSGEYNHNDLIGSFFPLINHLEQKILFTESLRPYEHYAFKKAEDEEYLLTEIPQESFDKISRFIIGITTRQSVSELVKTVEEGVRFKVLSPLSTRDGAIPGLKLSYFQDNEGDYLPNITGTSYFQIDIDEDEELWSRVQREAKLAILCSHECMSKYKVELFMLNSTNREGRNEAP